MAAPDPQTKDFFEWFGAVLLLILTLGGQAWRYIRESSKTDEEKPASSHVVIEQAEIADMSAIRAALIKLDRLLELEGDVEETKVVTAKMLTILERLDRQEEVDRRVQDELRRRDR